MSDACTEARAQLDRAETRLGAATSLVGQLHEERAGLTAEAADVDRRFQDGSASSVTLDGEHQAAIEDRSAKRAEAQSANEALAAAKAELAAAMAEQNPVTGTRLIDAQNELPVAQAAADKANAAYDAAEAEVTASLGRASKATAYLQGVANEREAIRTRTVTCDTKLSLAVADQASAERDVSAARAAVEAACR